MKQQIRWSFYVDNRIDYNRYLIEQNLRVLYSNVVHNFCRVNADIFKLRLAIAYKEPELAGLLLTGKPGIYALFLFLFS